MLLITIPNGSITLGAAAVTERFLCFSTNSFDH